MQVTRNNVSPTEVNLSITADAKELQPIKDAVVKRLGRDLKLPGFRPGKAPEHLLEKNINPANLENEFLQLAVSHFYEQAATKELIRPIGTPKVSLKKFVPYTTLEFDITIAVIGQVTLGDYKKIKKAKPQASVTAEDVNGVLASLARRAAEKVSVDRAAKNSDEVLIDFAGVDSKGEPINGAAAKDYPLVLGSDSFIPGFEEQIVGMKPGEHKSFPISFPKDYQVAALAGKKATFTVDLKTVNELIEPKIDDSFAPKVSPLKTLKELKEDIKQQLLYEAQTNINRQYENEILKDIADKSKVAIPKELVDEQITRNEEGERQNLLYRGQTWQEHLAEEGVTEEEHRERQRPTAEETVKVSLVLSEIARAEGVMVTPEELEVRITLLKGQYTDQKMRDELDKPENRQEISARLHAEKTIEKILSYVTQTKPAAKPKAKK
ncbi:MAG: trigger factor [Candidatus Saccharibacteria bacterium]|nr:trigger factor [Candidatus Saccharibacteria bacterium]